MDTSRVNLEKQVVRVDPYRLTAPRAKRTIRAALDLDAGRTGLLLPPAGKHAAEKMLRERIMDRRALMPGRRPALVGHLVDLGRVVDELRAGIPRSGRRVFAVNSGKRACPVPFNRLLKLLL
jgi:hypothetical protein